MSWLARSWPTVAELLLAHVLLAVPAVMLSVAVAVPLGRLAFRRPRIGGPLLGFASLLYAVPALPLLIVIPAIFGIPLRSGATVILALGIYGMALLVRTAADAFASVDPAVRQAAVAVGYSTGGIFWRVDLPLALPVILSGVRVVTVSTVGLVTIGALIGVPSLGSLLTDGFQRGIIAEVATGVVATIVLALVLDGTLVIAGRAFAPWARARTRAAGAAA